MSRLLIGFSGFLQEFHQFFHACSTRSLDQQVGIFFQAWGEVVGKFLVTLETLDLSRIIPRCRAAKLANGKNFAYTFGECIGNRIDMLLRGVLAQFRHITQRKPGRTRPGLKQPKSEKIPGEL
jgi:hypothetical protein